MSPKITSYLFIAAAVLVATGANDTSKELELDEDELARLATHSFRKVSRLMDQIEAAEKALLFRRKTLQGEPLPKEIKEAFEEADRQIMLKIKNLKWKVEYSGYLNEPIADVVGIMEHYIGAIKKIMSNIVLAFIAFAIMGASLTIMLGHVGIAIISTNVEDKRKLENMWYRIAPVFVLATMALLAINFSLLFWMHVTGHSATCSWS